MDSISIPFPILKKWFSVSIDRKFVVFIDLVSMMGKYQQAEHAFGLSVFVLIKLVPARAWNKGGRSMAVDRLSSIYMPLTLEGGSSGR